MELAEKRRNQKALEEVGRDTRRNHEPGPAPVWYGRASVSERRETNAMAPNVDQDAVIKVLNRILEAELAGVVRYTHYSLMVFGFNRIPITKWLRDQAGECLTHAQEAGEMVTHLGAHPSLAIGPLLETHTHDIGDILRESLAHEREGLDLYKGLLASVAGRSVLLEEYARKMVAKEEVHCGEVDKMLRGPGTIASVRGGEDGSGSKKGS